MAKVNKAENKRIAPFIPSLNWLVIGSTASILIIFMLIAGYHSTRVLMTNKLQDLFAITYLELDKKVQSLASDLRLLKKNAALLYSLDLKKGAMVLASGSGPKYIKLKDSGLDNLLENEDFAILKIRKHLFLGTWIENKNQIARDPKISVKNAEKIFSLSPLSARDLKNYFYVDQVGSLVYVANTYGDLIYSSSAKVKTKDFESRPLVQKFINHPLSQGQLEFVSDEGINYLGFFAQIPGSNLVLFLENPSQEVLASIGEVKKNLFLYFLGFLFVALALIQWPLMRIKKALRGAARLVNARISGDQFAIFPHPPILEILELENRVEALVESYTNNLKQKNADLLAHKNSRIEEFLKDQKIRDKQEIAAILDINTRQEKISANAIKIPYLNSAPDYIFVNHRSRRMCLGIIDFRSPPFESGFISFVSGMFLDYFPENDHKDNFGFDRMAAAIKAKFFQQESFSIGLVDIDLEINKASVYILGNVYALCSANNNRFQELPFSPSAPLGYHDNMSLKAHVIPLDGSTEKIVIATKGLGTLFAKDKTITGKRKFTKEISQLYHQDSQIFVQNIQKEASKKEEISANMSLITIDVKK